MHIVDDPLVDHIAECGFEEGFEKGDDSPPARAVRTQSSEGVISR